VRWASGKKRPVAVTSREVRAFLGIPRYTRDEALRTDQVGTATGLAWTAVGGDVLIVEARAVRGKGRLQLTGQLGDVMKESAQAALTFARSRAERYGLAADYFETHDIHVHVPEGAIPKDGPSAGVTMASAMISAFGGSRVRRDVAMTGEITLRGDVLPIGGLKEKVLAARRAGIGTVIVPRANRRDLAEVPKDVRRAMKFVFASKVDDVLDAALVDRPSARPARRPGRAAGGKKAPLKKAAARRTP
jgi:ATP-dependent Lon protease